MSVTFNKRETKRMAEVLQQDYATVEEAAAAALATAVELYESRAKYTVVGQLRYGPEGYVDADDARAAKVSLGMYSTEGQARSAGESLALGTSGEFVWWMLEVHHGSPAELHKKRKKAHEDAIENAKKEIAPRTGFDKWKKSQGLSSEDDFKMENWLTDGEESAA